jgi:hypothetical protein
MTAQTIQIDSIFTTDAEIFPFEPDDTIYGLSISGSVNLNSDTSLVRVILTDDAGNEWMAYEAYPLILPGKFCVLENVADETMYLQVGSPYSLKIQITQANINIGSIGLEEDYSENLETLQSEYKEMLEFRKVDSMNFYISNQNWNWNADTTPVSNYNYYTKKVLFGPKYNLLGIDYYHGGTYMSHRIINPSTDESEMVKSFDWRKKHNADIEGSLYWDGNLDKHWNGLTWEYEVNGWMTKVQCQESTFACAVFSSVACLEAMINLHFNHHLDSTFRLNLSERQVYNCTPYNTITVGCNPTIGKYVSDVYNFFKDDGVIPERCYPWRSPYCDGIYTTCDQNDSLYAVCETHDTIMFISDYEELTLSSAQNKTAYLKQCLIEKGPLTITLKKGVITQDVDHAVCLVGFSTDPETGSIDWIMKNSWGYFSNVNGYLVMQLNLNDHVRPKFYAINSPIITGPVNLFSRHVYDKDKDGYYNWGIGSKPDNLPCSAYSDKEDSNDNNNRIGPYDGNFNEIQVKPEMEVSHGLVNPTPINHKGFFFFSQDDIDLTVYITNPGTAQLNLAGVLPVSVIEEGTNYFDLLDPQPNSKICMNGGQSSFVIHFNTDYPEETCTALVRIQLDPTDIDLYDYFEFQLVYNGCAFNPEPYIVWEYESWNDPYKLMRQDVYIEEGGTLEVFASVAMHEYSDIFVEPGGKIINGGSIEYAKKGIETGRYDGYPYIPSGGIVYCDSAYFKDNQIGIKFYPYHYSPPGGVPVPNFSRIKNTEFEITDNFYTLDYSPGLDPLYGLNIGEIWGLQILGCSFLNSSDNSNTVRGNGIYSMNGGYWVARRCTDLIPQQPCSHYEICTFQNLDYGINALSDGTEWIIHIDSALLSGNYRGIFMSGINDPIITRCTFDCRDESDRFTSNEKIYGLYLDNCKRYQVEEDTFFSSYGYSGQEAVGLHILNSGPYYNEIYNNSFSDFHTGITAAGDNRDEYGTGLCLKCNDFTSCAFDIFVTPQGGRQESYLGIAEKQGEEAPPGNPDPTFAAGNTFSQDNGTNPNYTNEEGCHPIIYTHHGNSPSEIKIVPNPYDPPPPSIQITLNSDEDIDYNEKDIACPSHLEGEIVIENEKGTVVLKTALIEAVEDTLSGIVDGGDTEGLDFEIQTSFPDEALPLLQSLLDESPYLSDTILRSSIARENVLLNAMIRDILVANPQAAKTPAIMDRLENRFDPMPDYMMEEIIEGQNVYGAKEILEQHLASHKTARELSLSKVIRYFKTDTTNYGASLDSLETALLNENYPSARYELSFLFAKQSDSLHAFNTLESIPEEFDLNVNEEIWHSQYEILFNILWSIQSNTLDLDSTQIQQLFDMYQSNSIPGIFARNLLIEKQMIFYNEPVYLPDFYKNLFISRKPVDKVENESTYLKVYPNPSGNFFIVEYSLQNISLHSFLELSDLQGRILNQRDLNDLQNQIIVSTEDLTAGIYILRLFTNGYLKESLKVTVTK